MDRDEFASLMVAAADVWELGGPEAAEVHYLALFRQLDVAGEDESHEGLTTLRVLASALDELGRDSDEVHRCHDELATALAGTALRNQLRDQLNRTMERVAEARRAEREGRADEAMSMSSEALALLRSTEADRRMQLGPDDTVTLVAHSVALDLEHRLEGPKHTLPRVEAHAQHQRWALGPHHLFTLGTHVALGVLLIDQDPTRAVQHLEWIESKFATVRPAVPADWTAGPQAWHDALVHEQERAAIVLSAARARASTPDEGLPPCRWYWATRWAMGVLDAVRDGTVDPATLAAADPATWLEGTPFTGDERPAEWLAHTCNWNDVRRLAADGVPIPGLRADAVGELDSAAVARRSIGAVPGLSTVLLELAELKPRTADAFCSQLEKRGWVTGPELDQLFGNADEAGAADAG